jgi:DNA-binding transcriptional ArsR family regulator
VDSDLAFNALADPIRRRILEILSQHDECNAGELAEKVDEVGRTAVSGHLRILRTAGLISERKSGRFRYYSIDPSSSAREVIGLLQSVFQTSLDQLKETAEAAGETDSSNEVSSLKAM